MRPDISGYLDGVPIAIEVQISTLSPDLVLHRTSEYTKKGIYLLWISPWNEKLSEPLYSPRAWEKLIHGLYFGHVYYWWSRCVADYNFAYESRRYRTPKLRAFLDLLDDFSPRSRKQFKEFPAAKLFTAKIARDLGGFTVGATKASSGISATDWIAQQAISAYSGSSPTARHP